MKKEVFDLVVIGISFVIIIVSLLNITNSYTGRVSDFSTINVTISENARLDFTSDNVSFGYGSVNFGSLNATIDSTGNVINGNWTPLTNGFVIENTGNVNLSINLKTNQNASDLLRGTNPGFLYNVTNNEVGSCYNSSFNLGKWYTVNKTGDGTRVCSVFGFESLNDSINIDVRLIIPNDASVGQKTVIFTATGTAV